MSASNFISKGAHNNAALFSRHPAWLHALLAALYVFPFREWVVKTFVNHAKIVSATVFLVRSPTHQSDKMEEHELREETAANDGGLQPVQSQSLPPVDSGRAAWLFLLGCFVIELVLWGFPFSFGVFQVYYNTHPPISLESGSVSAIGTTCSVDILTSSKGTPLT